MLIMESEQEGIITKVGDPCTIRLDDGTEVLRDPAVLTILVQEE